MKVILLSGGAGKRLWPLSEHSTPKQFIQVLDVDGQKSSMLQRIYRIFRELIGEENIYIATNQHQADIVKQQVCIGSRMILEPEMRNTFPAIILSAVYLFHHEKVSLNESIVVVPIDSFATMDFYEMCLHIPDALKNNNAEIALIGTKPAFPSESYGYILPSESLGKYQFVDCFIEKPTSKIAHDIITKGGMWNTGIFGFELGWILDVARKYSSFDSYEDLYNNYSALKKISFDYEVVEKSKKIVALQYTGKWSDIGRWDTLNAVIKHNVGDAMCTNTDNTNIINLTDIPVRVVGVNNALICITDAGILIVNKEDCL